MSVADKCNDQQEQVQYALYILYICLLPFRLFTLCCLFRKTRILQRQTFLARLVESKRTLDESLEAYDRSINNNWLSCKYPFTEEVRLAKKNRETFRLKQCRNRSFFFL